MCVIERFRLWDIKAFLCFIFLFVGILHAFSAVQLKVQVKDKWSQDPLIGSSVVSLHQNIGQATDIDGFAQFILEPNTYTFCVHYLGYHSDTFHLILQADTNIYVELTEIANELEAVEVVFNYRTRSNGVVGIDNELLDKMPTFFGEREIIKAIQSLPGVQSGSEGSTSIFVRGGSSDQNLVTLDGIPLFHLSHLFGVLSVFNSDVVQKADLYKNYFSSALPNRLTSALNVFTKNPSYTEKHFSYQIGVLNTKIFFETPIIKDKLATYIAARGCHAGLYIKPITKSQYKLDDEKGYISYYFYDINAGLHYKVKSQNLLKWNFFFTDDRYTMFQEEERTSTTNLEQQYSIKYRENKLAWSNLNASFQHLKEWNSLSFFQQKFYLSQYKLKRGNNMIDEMYVRDSLLGLTKVNNTQFSSISEIGYQSLLDKTFQDHSIKTGIQTAWRLFSPDKSDFEEYVGENLRRRDEYNEYKIFTQEYAAFFEYQLKKKIVDIFSGVRFVYYKNGTYDKVSILPRISVEWKLPLSATIQFSSQINEQHLHMVNGHIGDIMKDYWVPANAHAPSESAWQQAISYKQHLHHWDWSVDLFYRSSKQQTESANTYNFRPNDTWETNIMSGGIGRAYGAEFYIAKKWKKINFSISYNLSKSERKFKELNRGQWFPYTHDRRHDVSAMVSYKFSPNFDISLAWVFGSGRPYSMVDLVYPSLQLVDYYADGYYNYYFLDNKKDQIQYNESRNNRKLTPFHHLDFGLNYKWSKKKWQHSLNLSIYNIYNHKNVFAVFEKHSGSGVTRSMKYQSITLLPTLPSISYAVGF